jgi:hypothetical protein
LIIGISILALYFSAQGVRPYVVGKGVPPTKEILLLQGLSQEERLPEGVKIISQPANDTILRNGTLKIAMSDGSVQEIPIVKVKKLTIETQ